VRRHARCPQATHLVRLDTHGHGIVYDPLARYQDLHEGLFVRVLALPLLLSFHQEDGRSVEERAPVVFLPPNP
jgi:hypothetical protein